MDKEIASYKIVRNKSEIALQQEVNRMIRQGWVPVGGISAVAFGTSPVGGNSFVQAMIKYKE